MVWLRVLVLVCGVSSGCIQSNLIACGDVSCPTDRVCDLATQTCVLNAQIEACAGLADMISCSYPGQPNGICSGGVCLPPRCGDGVVTGDEQCDDGASNSSLSDAACRPDCLPARCGDGIVDPSHGEVCDDGNTLSHDGCSADCRSNETCGNGVVDLVLGERCDDGNVRNHDGCNKGCDVEKATWVAQGPFTPPNRFWHAAAYDVSRGRLVVFGGVTSFPLMPNNETWEYDGTAWTQRLVGSPPPARYGHALAYDAARHRVVMFGGSNGATLNDTWEWDGVTWTQGTPPTAPPARTDLGMTYDAARKRIVVFGGDATGQSDLLGDTWEWDGIDWLQRTGTVAPIPRAGQALAYDPARARVVLFGGRDTTATYHFSSETWEWDGTAWAGIDDGAPRRAQLRRSHIRSGARSGRDVWWREHRVHRVRRSVGVERDRVGCSPQRRSPRPARTRYSRSMRGVVGW